MRICVRQVYIEVRIRAGEALEKRQFRYTADVRVKGGR